MGAILLAALLIGGCGSNPPVGADRPSAWGEPVASVPIDDLWRFEPGIYRGPQPEPDEIAQLQRLGVKTILNVRARHEDRALAQSLGIDYVQVPITAYRIEPDRVMQAMRVMLDESRRPIYIHCTRGGDRTGLLGALYRVLVQNWTKDEAIEEMTDGYNFLPIWQNMIWFVRDVDVPAWRRELGLPPEPARHPVGPQAR